MNRECLNCSFYEIETYNNKKYDWCMWYGVHVPTYKKYLCNHWEYNSGKAKVNIHKRIHKRLDEVD